ncbi:hypothetical protein Tdes44962_MAKER08847 [Teratosphaeria destructans]|uniref:Uncharacterized protein n=1 Tax=Teratosphaeria destructans TaxID=418781 RepID=A0A9W7SUR7_9PEZI|nr:hypothetical protein Tdes44962_MAKER08847 [Teratosphaeria destructans]
MPYATSPPKICAQPLNENQMPVRLPCSLVVYHCEVMRAKPGVTAASHTPSMNLMATAPEKSWTAAKQASTRPQAMIQDALYLPMGRRWRRRLVGYSQAR